MHGDFKENMSCVTNGLPKEEEVEVGGEEEAAVGEEEEAGGEEKKGKMEDRTEDMKKTMKKECTEIYKKEKLMEKKQG